MHERFNNLPQSSGPEEVFGAIYQQAPDQNIDSITETAVKDIDSTNFDAMGRFLEGFSQHLISTSEPERLEYAQKLFADSDHWALQWASIEMQSRIIKMHADWRTKRHIYAGLGTTLRRWADAERLVIDRIEREKTYQLV